MIGRGVNYRLLLLLLLYTSENIGDKTEARGRAVKTTVTRHGDDKAPAIRSRFATDVAVFLSRERELDFHGCRCIFKGHALYIYCLA